MKASVFNARPYSPDLALLDNDHEPVGTLKDLDEDDFCDLTSIEKDQDHFDSIPDDTSLSRSNQELSQNKSNLESYEVPFDLSSVDYAGLEDVTHLEKLVWQKETSSPSFLELDSQF